MHAPLSPAQVLELRARTLCVLRDGNITQRDLSVILGETATNVSYWLNGRQAISSAAQRRINVVIACWLDDGAATSPPDRVGASGAPGRPPHPGVAGGPSAGLRGGSSSVLSDRASSKQPVAPRENPPAAPPAHGMVGEVGAKGGAAGSAGVSSPGAGSSADACAPPSQLGAERSFRRISCEEMGCPSALPMRELRQPLDMGQVRLRGKGGGGRW